MKVIASVHLGPRLHQALASTLRQLCNDVDVNDPVLIENNGFASEWGSSRPVSQASSQYCRSVDADAQCERSLIGLW